MLNEMCSNFHEIFEKGEGGRFRCTFDAERWDAFANAMRALE